MLPSRFGRGVDAVAAMCDLREPAESSAVIEDVLARWSGVDILVNNAGIGYYGRTEAMTAGQWDRLLAVNLSAPIQITRELLPSMLARDEAHILNMCSILGLVAFKRMAAYHTSKFALVGFSLCCGPNTSEVAWELRRCVPVSCRRTSAAMPKPTARANRSPRLPGGC